MKYPYTAIYGGKWYAPGEEVPDGVTEQKTEAEEVKTESASENVLPKYEKAQINKLKGDEVKALAVNLGFNADLVKDTPVGELKRNIISYLKL